MMPSYKIELTNGVTDVRRLVRPRWKSDLALNVAYENGQMFRRTQLSGDVVFVGSDYDYIAATPFENTITLYISVSYDNGESYQPLYSGTFHHTDCTFDADNKSVKVRPQIADRYSKILAGLDKEYDLCKLTPALQPVTIIRRPMIQVYVPSDSVVTCYLSGMVWEEDAVETTSAGTLTDDYHFGKVNDFAELNFTGNVPQYLTGTFIGTIPKTSARGEWRVMENEQQMYYITYFQRIEQSVTSPTGYMYINGLRVYSVQNTSQVLWEYEQQDMSDYEDIPDEITLDSKRSGVADLTAELSGTPVYARWLVAKDSIGGGQAYPLSGDDLVSNNRNYKYVIPFGLSDLVVMSYNHREEPTQWGIRPDGDYYQKPDDNISVIDYFPVARSTWNYASMWLCQTEATETIEQSGRTDTLIRDAYTIESVISALLGEIDDSVTFEGTQTYSRFLFGVNPLINSAYWGRLVMCPKTNVLVAEYTQPAQKAVVTLGEVFDMLKKALGCYWYINDSGQLIVEHLVWFRNGGSYAGTPAIGIDLTEAVNTRNSKTWSFGTNAYSYDKMEMPERYEYSWMDDTTNIFKGEPIEVLSTYVEEGKIEDVTISKFNPDIDYMLLNPSNVNEDGFALMLCKVTNGAYATDIESISLVPNQVQNWQLTMGVLQNSFLTYDMPSWNLKVNGQATLAKGIQRKKKQKVSIPLGAVTPNQLQLVHTGLGDGEIQSMDINLTSRMAETQLVYDTTEL